MTDIIRRPTLRVLRALIEEPRDGLTLKEQGILGRVNLRELRQSGWIAPAAIGTGWRVTALGRQVVEWADRHPEVVR